MRRHLGDREETLLALHGPAEVLFLDRLLRFECVTLYPDLHDRAHKKSTTSNSQES